MTPLPKPTRLDDATLADFTANKAWQGFHFEDDVDRRGARRRLYDTLPFGTIILDLELLRGPDIDGTIALVRTSYSHS